MRPTRSATSTASRYSSVDIGLRLGALGSGPDDESDLEPRASSPRPCEIPQMVQVDDALDLPGGVNDHDGGDLALLHELERLDGQRRPADGDGLARHDG